MRHVARFICKSGNLPNLRVLSESHLRYLVNLHMGNFEAEEKLNAELAREGILNVHASGQVSVDGMIISTAGGSDLFLLADRYTQEVEDILLSHLDEIRSQSCAVLGCSPGEFPKYAFFVLSNVLLDNWQIQNIESLYLRTERPLRGGKRFYLAIMEEYQNGNDPFGIYGNISLDIGGTQCCFYGNRQGKLKSDDFDRLKNSNEILKLNQKANSDLSQVASIVRDELVDYFQSIEQDLKAYHSKSPWRQLSYAEFFIWWYHFLYTRSTDNLARRGEILIPESGMFPYLVEAE